MQLTGTPKSDGADLERLWRQVCASRGTPAPDPAQLAGFMEGLGAHERERLESVLALAARGREPPGELGLLSWAAACTRPALLSQLHSHGLAFTGAGLFACGLKLREEGWDMQHRIAQLGNNPGDVDTLRALLPVESGEPEADPQKGVGPSRHEEMAVDKPFFPWPDDDASSPDGQAPGWEREPMDDVQAAAASNPSAVLPVLPTRFERQRPEPFAHSSGASGATKVERPMEESRLRLRLFGKAAAHTLEITPHRRGGDFMGVHVVSIDSAHALGAGGGYAWERKLVIQLTPEEMPAVIATLMGLTPSVRFGHHGANRDKFVEVRRQAGGLVMVTGEHAVNYPVPVPAGTVYYVLDLFCRAMAMGREVDKPGRSVADVLMLVRSAHGF
ncbi:hypothetical protein [Polaromonas sp.]|uniref:hypothetical protein n=1 Tax=Polaromonas sp. TaxID=1869339 RepID=UPI003BB56F2B